MDFKRARDAFAARDVARVCGELAKLYPSDPELHRLPEFVRFAFSGGQTPSSDVFSTRAFLQCMAAVSKQDCYKHSSRHNLSKDFDFIADLDGAAGWSVVQALNRLKLDGTKPRHRCAVVGTMRDDGIYIMEWVAHYLALGFEHLFIYTNDNGDSSDMLFELLADHGIITLLYSEVTGEVPPEAKAFGHALHLLEELRDYEWVLFVDSDEFLMPATRYHHSIQNVFKAVDQKFPDKRVAGICYDWLWFVSDMVFERKPGLLCERFQHARPHWLTKCLVRVSAVESMRQQHHPEVFAGFLVVDSEFRSLDMATIWERRDAQYGGGHVSHYWPKSFQEFAIKKARGASLKNEENMYDRPYKNFFLWNGYATESNAHSTDPELISLVKKQMEDIRKLEGIAAIADRIDSEFGLVLAQVADNAQLRKAYEINATEPGEL